jgi:DNA-binding transcriptional regulator/RsmH inhibitor MraZ
LEFAGIQKDALLTPLNDRIEIWSPDRYDAMIGEMPDDLSALAEDVLGGAGIEKTPEE